jgi:glycolate oxidase FAD binding subunit
MLAAFQERIRAAAGGGTPLRLRGSGSKDFYGGGLAGEVLDTRGHAGIVSYEPTELVVTARCGTRLDELEATLAASGQMLAFEPPRFGAQATLGGCVAAGLSGPRRAAAGAVRDFVLGARLLDGRARELSFGGQVMKNVAGYDVSRLLAGSLGTLGLILEVSLKVLPRPAQELTLQLELSEEGALEALNRWGGQPLPISASAWRGGVLWLRLSGAASAVRAAAKRIGGIAVEDPWTGIREHTDPYFAGDMPLWRLSVPSHAPALGLPGDQMIEWGGALRWLRTAADAGTVHAAAERAGGHATRFRAVDKPAAAFAPMSPILLRLHRELKAAFDPAGIFNRGRLHPGF